MSRPSQREIARRSRLRTRTRRGKQRLDVPSSRPAVRKPPPSPVLSKAERTLAEITSPVSRMWRNRRDRGEIKPLTNAEVRNPKRR